MIADQCVDVFTCSLVYRVVIISFSICHLFVSVYGIDILLTYVTEVRLLEISS